MVGVCDGGQDRGRSEGSVTTTEAQEGRTRRGEVRTVQERESRELELKLELPGRCQGREPGPVLATWAGPGNRGAGPGPRRGIALLQCPPQVRQVWSAVTPTNAATVNQGRAGGSGGGLGGVWVLGGGGELAGWQCGLWRRIQWRPLASEVLASGLGPALHVPPPVLHFPTTFFVSRTPSFSKKNRQKIPLPRPVHRMTDRTCQVSPLSPPLKRAGSSAQGAT